LENDKNLKALSNFLKFFINRPNHLARYLIDHGALSENFLNNLSKNPKLGEETSKSVERFFVDINQMNHFFNSLIENKKGQKLKDLEDLRIELNKELGVCIKEERYEDAIRIRDYLKKIDKDTD